MRQSLLVLALILLVVGFPFFLFGLFLVLAEGQNGIEMGVAYRFAAAGFVSIGSALGIRTYLLRRDVWF